MEGAPGSSSLSSEDWDRILSALAKSHDIETAKKLKAEGNRAFPADVLFSGARINEAGQNAINSTLHNKGVPFRLSRIGKYERGEGRRKRLLAFVPCEPKIKPQEKVEKTIRVPFDHEDGGRNGD